MKAQLVFFPPGSDKYEYYLDFELPGVPNPGDFISIRRPQQEGTEDFIVRRCRWELEHPTNHLGQPPNKIGSVQFLVIDCEYAIGPHSMEHHKKTCEAHEKRGDYVARF